MRYFLLPIFMFFLCFENVNGQSIDSAALERKALRIEDVNAENDSDKITVVSASRSGKNLEDLPITAFVVTKEEIKKNGYVSLNDVLKSVPGIRISRPGAGVSGETFLMRGLIGNNYTKILINNVPIQPSAIGGIPLGEQLPISQAEAIEIIYGPASSVYGADAMSGVINIITQQSEQKPITQVNVLAGEHGYHHANFLVANKFGKNKNVVNYSVYGNFAGRTTWDVEQHGSEVFGLNTDINFIFSILDLNEQQESFLRQNPEVLFDFLSNNPDAFPEFEGTFSETEIANLPHQSQLFGTTLNFKDFELELSHHYRRDHASLGLNPLVFSYSDPNTFIGETIQRARLSYKKDWNKFNIQSNLSYLRYRQDVNSYIANNQTNNEGKAYSFNASDDIFGEALFTFTPNSYWELTAGMSATFSSAFPETNTLTEPFDLDNYKPYQNIQPPPQEVLGNFGFNPQTFNTVGSFLQAYYNKNKWAITGGLRFEVPSNYGESSNLFSRLAILYKITPKLSIRLTGGGAFKAPSPNVTFNSIASVSSGQPSGVDSIFYTLVPNPNLQPEVLTSSELGLRWQVSKKIYLEFISYQVEIDELITTTLVPLDRETYPLGIAGEATRTNINDENSNGVLYQVEFILRMRNLIEKLKLNSDFYLSFAEGEEELPENRGTLNGYRLVPVWQAKWNIDFEPFKNAYFRAENTYSGEWFRRFIPVESAQNRSLAKISGFYNLDVTFRYKIGKSLETFTRVYNAFDAKYGGIDARGADVDLIYNPQIGRNIQFGITYRR